MSDAHRTNTHHGRTRARRTALQALYQWDLAGQDIGAIQAQFLQAQDMRKVDTDYFKELLHEVPAQLSRLDENIAPYLDRPMAQLDPIERAILRMGGMIDARMRQRDPEQARMGLSLAPDNPVEYVHTRDAATALVNVLDRPEAHDRIHLIGGGKDCQVTTLRMMQTMMGALGIEVSADDLGSEPANGPWVDTTESQRLLSFQRHTVEDLERECYERFRHLRPFVRPLSPLIMRAMKLWLRP